MFHGRSRFVQMAAATAAATACVGVLATAANASTQNARQLSVFLMVILRLLIKSER